MAQQLPLVQVPMPQQQPIIGVDMTQQDYNNLQQQGLANIMPDQSLINRSMQQQQPQVVTDAGRKGVDWAGLLGSLGSYVSAAGSAYGSSANPSQGLLNATNATRKLTQDINQYNTMAPYYQQLGYDVSKLDPRRGGAGVASTPESMIQLQSLVDQRKMNNEYRQQMIEAMQQKQQGTQGGKVLTVGQLMMLSPEFKARMQGQYDFSNGQNADLLNQQLPVSLLQGYMPAKKVNMNYTGGLKSSKTSNATIRHGGGSGGGKSGGSKKLIF